MSERTKIIAAEILRQPQKNADFNLDNFLGAVDTRLKNLRDPDVNSIEHRGLYNKEITQFLKNVFPEIENFEEFMALLGVFGFKGGFFSDLHIFYDKNAPGFLIAQLSRSAPLDSVQRSSFCLLCEPKKDGGQVLTIAGVNDKRILMANYQSSPSENAYEQTGLSVGVSQEEIKNFSSQDLSQIHLSSVRTILKPPLITQAMIKKTPNYDWLLSLDGNQQILETTPSLQKFRQIPQRIATVPQG